MTSRGAISRKQKKERGAALVEAAIVFLPLCLIVFGIIEYGFIFKDSLTISSATRAGARTASAEPHYAGFLEDTKAAVTREAVALNMKNGDTLSIFEADAAGNPIAGNTITYKWNGSSFGNPSGSYDVAGQQACLGQADSVGVSMQISHDALSGFFKNMKLKEKTVMRLEPLSTDCGG